MNIHQTGALVSRGVDVGLVVMGFSSSINWPIFWPDGGAVSGWTSYSPQTVNVDAVTQLHDTYFTITNMVAAYGPGLLQVTTGLLMIVLSKRVGRWLSSGLSDQTEP